MSDDAPLRCWSEDHLWEMTVDDARLVHPRPDDEPSGHVHPQRGRPAACEVVPLAKQSRLLGDVARLLRSRRSIRNVGPITLDALASTLVGSYQIVGWATGSDGYQRTWRPAPSAGGRHPFDLLVDASGVEGLDDGAWMFDAFTTELYRVDVDLAEARAAVRSAARIDVDPSATVFLIADPERTLSAYEHGVTLVWRDAGAAAVTIQLAAIAAGLGASIIGTAGRIDLADESVDVAAVMLGPSQTSVD